MKFPFNTELVRDHLLLSAIDYVELKCNKLQLNSTIKMHFSKFNSINPQRNLFIYFGSCEMNKGGGGGRGDDKEGFYMDLLFSMQFTKVCNSMWSRSVKRVWLNYFDFCIK